MIHTKYKIGDIVTAKKDIVISRWSKELCEKDTEMQIAEIKIVCQWDNTTNIIYQLCFPDKAPFFRLELREESIDSMFKLSKINCKLIPCKEWYED